MIGLHYDLAQTVLTVRNALVPHETAQPVASSHPGPGDGRGGSGGYGLAGMHERLLLLGGTLTAGRAGDEWVV